MSNESWRNGDRRAAIEGLATNGRRLRLFMDWGSANLPAGAYRVGLAIESQDHAITYVSSQDTGSIRVGRDPTGMHGVFFP
jgi:hypothetical protein